MSASIPILQNWIIPKNILENLIAILHYVAHRVFYDVIVVLSQVEYLKNFIIWRNFFPNSTHDKTTIKS